MRPLLLLAFTGLVLLLLLTTTGSSSASQVNDMHVGQSAASFDHVAAAMDPIAATAVHDAAAAVVQQVVQQQQRALREETVEQPRAGMVVPCGGKRQRRCCGDGVCNGPETLEACPADCPGVTTDKMCGEEPHSDTGGYAVVFGINHRAASAQDCCDKCRQHATNARNAKRPCNSWVFCPLPVCWGLDTGWNHTFGECWLKYQQDPSHPLYGQRGRYTDEYRARHRHVRTGPPTHVPWTGGVIGGTFNPSIKWTTGVEGMRSSQGDELTNWRAWEAPGLYEKRLAQRRRRGKGAGSAGGPSS